MLRLDAAGRLPQVGRWNTLVSVLPIKYSVEDDEEPLEDEPDELLPDELPPEVVPDPDPPLTVPPPGRVKVAPLVENTTLPFLSVR